MLTGGHRHCRTFRSLARSHAGLLCVSLIGSRELILVLKGTPQGRAAVYHFEMKGYSKVANFMCQHDEFAILRGFKRLNIQNLLYLQAEITHLEAELVDLEDRDARCSDREYHTSDWWSLTLGEKEEEGDLEQWDKVLKLRDKLNQYSESTSRKCYLTRLTEVQIVQSCSNPRYPNWTLLPSTMLAFSGGGSKDQKWEHSHSWVWTRLHGSNSTSMT